MRPIPVASTVEPRPCTAGIRTSRSCMPSHSSLRFTGTRAAACWDSAARVRCSSTTRQSGRASCRRAASPAVASRPSKVSARRTNPIVQAAFIAAQAAQCGYCTTGCVMATKALLMRTPNPTIDQAKEALAGNLCRCGAHTRLLRSCSRVTEPPEPRSDPAELQSARLAEGGGRPRRQLHLRRAAGFRRAGDRVRSPTTAGRSIPEKSTASSRSRRTVR